MRIGMMRVVMTVAVAVAVFVIVTMPVVMPMLMIVRFFIGLRRARADALDMVMMAFLGEADFGLETEDLFAVLAELAVHVVFAAADLVDAGGGTYVLPVVGTTGTRVALVAT